MPYLRNLEVLFLLTLLLATSGSVGFAQAPRVPAEWQPHEATWIQWPKGIESSYRPNFAAIIDVIQDYEPLNIVVQSTQARSQAQNYLANQGVGLTNLSWHILPYDWAWLRDNGPLWVEEGGEQRVQDWSFDGWGGIVPFWDLDDAVPCQIAAIESVPCEVHSLINERGNLEFNGVDTLITSWPVFTDRNPETKIDPHRVVLFGWSSSGPALYAHALRKRTPVSRYFVAMSVFKPKYLPSIKLAKGKSFFLYHSPDDQVCRFGDAKRAKKDLAAAGARVEILEYEGGHGWRGNVFGNIKKGIKWLFAEAAS